MENIFSRIISELYQVRSLIPTYLHVLFSALFSIYIGAHASLSRPSSAAVPEKSNKKSQGDECEDEADSDDRSQKMEGLSPADAIIFPLLAGCTLAGLYFLIKWLEDPALLNKILNLYFSVFGILSVARLLTDSMGVVSSYAFPTVYAADGKIWRVIQKERKVICISAPSAERISPLPGWLSNLGLSANQIEMLWSIREIPSLQLRVRIYIHKLINGHSRIGPQGSIGLVFAVFAVVYFNVVDKPWWLTNLLGFSFAYSALQLMSPTTFWTGTMILSSLFLYDIYFVFFTPLMVTVAKKLDIPAKLLFPRPSGPDEDSSKQSLAMLGLGDIVLPGIMIGLALRFDLYLFYLRKQYHRATTEETPGRKEKVVEIVKPKWKTATSGWGERFWAGRRAGEAGFSVQGGEFPKTYFHASLIGYGIGMISTLVIMQVFGHAQPALLYLVPGVLSVLWGTAFVKGEIKLMWEFNEAVEEDAEKKDSKGIESIFSLSRQPNIVKQLEDKANMAVAQIVDSQRNKIENQSERSPSKAADSEIGNDELMLLSISFPRNLLSKSDLETPAKEDSKAIGPILDDEVRLEPQVGSN